jgi:predicted nucleotidyltransferase
MLKDLKKYLESEKKDKTIFDIIVYGSFVKGKNLANDLDAVVIFLEGTLRERLDKIQEIKQKIKLDIKVDMKQILITELFDSNFLARTGVLIEGISLFSGKKLSEVLGFKAGCIFDYDLSKMTHVQKVKFNYILSGRNSKGMIEILKGKRLGIGAVTIPIENSIAFEELLKKYAVKFTKKNILEEI